MHVKKIVCYTVNNDGGVIMKIINGNEFESTISSGVVLVDFFATWCGPCKMLSPVLEQVSEELAGKVEIVKVDVDQDGDLAAQFGIMSVPTMIVFKDGTACRENAGICSSTTIKRSIRKNVIRDNEKKHICASFHY